ncbi:MAG: hypothetical protein WCT04_03430 [Planctomycetota bacterium]
MKTTWIAGMAVLAMAFVGTVRADDANSEAAKAIQEIAARRAEKVEARMKQAESGARQEGRERGGFGGGTGVNVNPGQPTRGLQIK